MWISMTLSITLHRSVWLKESTLAALVRDVDSTLL